MWHVIFLLAYTAIWIYTVLCGPRDAAKAQAVQDMMERYNSELRDSGAFPAASSGDKESPQTRVWVLYFLAQHYDYLGWV